jgi:hypothetical protein
MALAITINLPAALLRAAVRRMRRFNAVFIPPILVGDSSCRGSCGNYAYIYRYNQALKGAIWQPGRRTRAGRGVRVAARRIDGRATFVGDWIGWASCRPRGSSSPSR